ncbi:preprotein translocase subunit YajC [Anaeromicropila populeti]|uniref:Protein translocase subunit yajC n=1 Tax=Anaeromicropila populeti TaxID=37658 RepID=A0A1I6IQX9_9FIRM|nr:preprotein translocase subunit YajC [Anaeromicropila populeti]SFR69118.1 protein translocase subunit yajC [Anaeromicropila populeti]
MNLPAIFLAADTASMLATFLPIIAMFLVFYFLVMRPQKKQQREHDALVASVEIGDSILTTSGFYGVIIDVMPEIVIVEFGSNKNCRIPMKRESIVSVEKPKKES